MSDSNEIARRTDTRPTPSEVDSWAKVFRPLVQLAEHVHDTEFVPRALRGNAPATAAAMLYGRELGMGPMRALQTVHVVDGRPTLAAEAMRAMTLAAGHEIVYREHTRAKCVVSGRRNGSQTYTTVEWSLQDARDSGLANKPNWRKMPRQMLVARATGELCRLIFADVIGGAYTPEELADGSAPDPVPVDAEHEPTSKRRTAQRKTRVTPSLDAAPSEQSTKDAQTVDKSTKDSASTEPPPLPADEPDEPLDGELVDDNNTTADTVADAERPQPDDDERVTDTQLRKLHAVFTEHDYTDRDHKLRIAQVITDRADLTSSTQLTRREASTMLDTLAQLDATGEFSTALDALIDEFDTRQLDNARDAATHPDNNDDGGTP